MPLIYESDVPELRDCYVRDPAPAIVDWRGRKALRLSGQGASLVILTPLQLAQGRIAVDIGAEGAAYAGVAFHIADTCNFELAYAQPHTSGQWDALQYDPIFHGSNSWQLVYGPHAQAAAIVPPQTWFRLSVEFSERQARIRVGEQAPLLVPRLAHAHGSGGVGLWTYLPAHFAHMQVWDDAPPDLPEVSGAPEAAPAGCVTEWFLEGFGVVACEPNGILNVNRYLPATVEEVRLVRWLETPEPLSLEMRVGYSDELTLEVDGQAVFSGRHVFHSSPKWEERGYVEARERVHVTLAPGRHQLAATLRMTELFGFGMIVNLGEGVKTLLPAGLHPLG